MAKLIERALPFYSGGVKERLKLARVAFRRHDTVTGYLWLESAEKVLGQSIHLGNYQN